MEVELDSLDVKYDRKKSEPFFPVAQNRFDGSDLEWGRKGVKFGQAIFNIQIERSSRLLDL